MTARTAKTTPMTAAKIRATSVQTMTLSHGVSLRRRSLLVATVSLDQRSSLDLSGESPDREVPYLYSRGEPTQAMHVLTDQPAGVIINLDTAEIDDHRFAFGVAIAV
jgi:hypothetical protein